MTSDTDLIVLHTTKYGDSSIVVHALSREYGRRSFFVRGAGKKAAMSLFLPLNILEAEIVGSSVSKLFTARKFSMKHPLLGIRNSYYKNSIAMFLSEVLFRALKEGGAEQGLFEWCERDILLLDAMKSDYSNFHIRFLLEMAVMLGFSPDSDDIAPFAGEHQAIMERFLKEPFDKAMLIPLSGAVRNMMAEEILRYIEFHQESPLTVNSLTVLRELFV